MRRLRERRALPGGSREEIDDVHATPALTRVARRTYSRRMSTSRVREIWRHRERGDAYLVELESDRVVSAEGPLTEDQLGEDALAWKQAAEGRAAAFTPEAADLDGRRNEFERERAEAPM
jgi:hypothetical protein